jgi:transposase-like protein
MKPTRDPRYAHHRFPAEVIGYAIGHYFRFHLSIRMVEEMLAARGIEVSHETVRLWARKFGQSFANQIRRRLPAPGDKGDVTSTFADVRRPVCCSQAKAPVAAFHSAIACRR